MTAKEIASAIAFGTFSTDEMNSIVEAIKYNRAQKNRNTRNSLCRGDTVEFRARNGRMIRGTVQEIKIKNVMVLENGLRWKVPANMLTIVSRPKVAA